MGRPDGLSTVQFPDRQERKGGIEGVMKIRISNGANEIIYELNDSTTAKELYDQLPLEANVENFGTNEKVFYPPKKEMSVEGTPESQTRKGEICYYTPWKAIVMFYGDHGKMQNMYSLGKVVSGMDRVRKLFGKIKVTRE